MVYLLINLASTFKKSGCTLSYEKASTVNGINAYFANIKDKENMAHISGAMFFIILYRFNKLPT